MRSLKNTLQLLLVAAAGVASFYIAMQWRRASPSEAPPLVALVSREHRPSIALAPHSPTPEHASATSNRANTLMPPDRTHVVPNTTGDAFAKLIWVAPPPVVRPAPPPPPTGPVVPVAPPLPFTFVGLMEQGTVKPQAFLSKGDILLVVAAGDMIDNNTYRVDSLSAQQIVITYLPLNMTQTLSILGTSK